MIVDVDVGNTRLKWRLSSAKSIVDRGSLMTHSEDWSVLSFLSAREPARIRVSNVAGDHVAERLRVLAQNDLGIKVEFAFAAKSLGEVRSAYKKPELLGVDRWLAIVAGWDVCQKSCVVVDAGSALTLDFIDSEGKHEGGFILPGREMMRSSLYGGTSGVRVDGENVAGLSYGQTTEEAVNNGCLAMVLALLEKSASIGLDGPELAMVMTGGDAPALLKYLPDTVCYRPDLVLEGLALALP